MSSVDAWDRSEVPDTGVEGDRTRHLYKSNGMLVLYDTQNGDAWMESDTTAEDWVGDGR